MSCFYAIVPSVAIIFEIRIGESSSKSLSASIAADYMEKWGSVFEFLVSYQ
ncbi:hypothetical protein [Phormidesmis priestleyi]|uniref:hypothetical protein n=1 Tax=Phormidesmis priestleyi TaxID=268141 RepID=UPI0015E72AF6|nr:hypothetical protein [Phormidesmis priestleyi]